MADRVCCFFFSGYYATAAAANILTRHGVNGRVVKSPVLMRYGCSFTLMVREDEAELAEYLLDRENVIIENKIFMNMRL